MWSQFLGKMERFWGVLLIPLGFPILLCGTERLSAPRDDAADNHRHPYNSLFLSKPEDAKISFLDSQCDDGPHGCFQSGWHRCKYLHSAWRCPDAQNPIYTWAVPMESVDTWPHSGAYPMHTLVSDLWASCCWAARGLWQTCKPSSERQPFVNLTCNIDCSIHLPVASKQW